MSGTATTRLKRVQKETYVMVQRSDGTIMHCPTRNIHEPERRVVVLSPR
jgi:hypothetical protein